jgi:hypothetical protein
VEPGGVIKEGKGTREGEFHSFLKKWSKLDEQNLESRQRWGVGWLFRMQPTAMQLRCKTEAARMVQTSWLRIPGNYSVARQLDIPN